MNTSDRPDGARTRLQSEAAHGAIHHLGPTADRYATALERYVAAVSADPGEQNLPARASTFPPMTVADVMTRSVVCAYPNAQFKEIARALHRNGINSVPVINDERHVIGVVTASDVLARVGHSRPLPRGHRLGHYDRRHKIHAALARDLMTSPAVTIPPAASIAEAARLLTRYRLRSLPVVSRRGDLVGMVSRADLIELFLRSDADISHDVERDVVRKAFEPKHANVHVSVVEGVVTLSGRVETALVARGLAYRAAEVPGVVDVEDHIEWDVNDVLVPARH